MKRSWVESTVTLTANQIKQYKCNGNTNAVLIRNPDNDVLIYAGFSDVLNAQRHEKMIKNNSTALMLKLFTFPHFYMVSDGNVQVTVTEIFTEEPLALIQNVLQEGVYYQEMPLIEKSADSGIYVVTALVETIIDCRGYKRIELFNRGGGLLFFDFDRVADGLRPNLSLVVDEYRGYLVRCDDLHLIAQLNAVNVEVVLWR